MDYGLHHIFFVSKLFEMKVYELIIIDLFNVIGTSCSLKNKVKIDLGQIKCFRLFLWKHIEDIIKTQ